MKRQVATYVYGVIAGARQPRFNHPLTGLEATGRVRLLPVVPSAAVDKRASSRRKRSALKLWLAVADAPLDRYGEAAVNRGLRDLDWVARAAVAHERVVESFSKAAAVLPMKLFTIFSSDERALDHIGRQRDRIDTLLSRVRGHDEWGVRIVLDSSPPRSTRRLAKVSGAEYLARKKAQRDYAEELATRAREVAADVYEDLVHRSAAARRRSGADLPLADGPLLLDAAFLVARTRADRFRAFVARRARALASQGYHVSLTGPWPPYSFVQE